LTKTNVGSSSKRRFLLFLSLTAADDNGDNNDSNDNNGQRNTNSDTNDGALSKSLIDNFTRGRCLA